MAESTTSAIDEKKEETNTKNKNGSNIGYFALNSMILFIILLVYFGCSGLLLYVCKLAQSNILPTDHHCSPYTDTTPKIEEIETNIFSTTDPTSREPLSMKIKFPYNEYNARNKFIDMLSEYKKKSDSNFLANYFISILETLIQMNYSSLNTIFNMMNGLPEFLLILLGPILATVITSVVFIFDNLYLIYLWFANMGWLFKTNTNDSSEGKPKWEDVTIVSPFNYGCAVGLVILFIILFFLSFGVLFPFIAFMSIAYCLISCITYKAEMNGKRIQSSVIMQEVFKYYKEYILSIFSFLVIINAFASLGTLPGIFSIITLALIYFGIISINIFKPNHKENVSPIVSYEQAKKTCSYSKPPKESHWFSFQSGGTNLAKELKKYGKKYYRK